MNLWATIITPVGRFVGRINGVDSSIEDLKGTRDAMQMTTLNRLTLYVGESGTREITFQEVLSQSVIIYDIQESAPTDTLGA